MKLSVVIPIYNEQENLGELYRRLRMVCDGLENMSWQVIYVNDGSQDDSLKIMRQQSREDPRFCIVNVCSTAPVSTFVEAKSVPSVSEGLPSPSVMAIP